MTTPKPLADMTEQERVNAIGTWCDYETVMGTHQAIIEKPSHDKVAVLFEPGFGYFEHDPAKITPRPTDDGRDFETKYWEAQAQIDKYEAERQPKTVTTEEEYAALPAGSVVSRAGGRGVYRKLNQGRWECVGKESIMFNADLAIASRTVLREGWGE